MKLNIANYEVHNIDKLKLIFPQLFKIIYPNGYYDKLTERLRTINADIIILNSIINKEIYYKKYEKKTLNESENKIFDEVNPEKLMPFLLRLINKGLLLIN